MKDSSKKKRRRRRLRVPREEIAWFPLIDQDLCNRCSACYDYCPKDVFASEEVDKGLGRRSKMTVANPYNCIVLCSACRKICAAEAISFPSREDFEHCVEYLDQE